MLGTGIGADPEVSLPGDPGKIILWLFFREVFLSSSAISQDGTKRDQWFVFSIFRSRH